MKNTCTVDDCDGDAHGRGLCGKHYQRFKKHGTTDRPGPTTAQRFLVRFDERPGGCWEWRGNRYGGRSPETAYGEFFYGGRKGYAHRFSYEHYIGPIPDGMQVCHHCDNPICVNPAHLFLGTHADNAADRETKGRGKHPKKLTPDQWQHGTRSTYVSFRCRCRECQTANSTYMRAFKLRREGTPETQVA